MDFPNAWKMLDKALDVGTQAAHGAGLVNRHEVAQIGEAQQAVADHINALTEANQQLAAELQKRGEKKPCDCEEKADADIQAMNAQIAAAEAEVTRAMEG